MVIDTNVILRLLVRDHPRHTEEAKELFASKKPLTITDVVLMECTYLLAGAYGKTRIQVHDVLQMLLKRENVVYEAKLASHYLKIYASHASLDLADCYSIALAIARNEPLRAFDKKMQKAYESEIELK